MLSAKRLVVLFWLGSAIAIAVMAWSGPTAWDYAVYRTAAESIHRGGDPYAEGIAVQKAFHNRVNKDPGIHSPMTYVYSPITLPVLRVIGSVPGWLSGTIYGMAFVAGFLLQLWAVWQMATKSERQWLQLLLPAVAFFPGLLNDDVVLSGNIAYLLYGLVLAAAVPGWKRGRWGWYYLAVLAASCCKAPLLTLLAFPVLIGRRQWSAAVATGTVGCLLFFAQAKLWPTQFSEYLRAVQLQFDWNSDFGISPAGLLGKALVQKGLPYSMPTTILYLAFACAVGIVLLWRAKRVRDNPPLRDNWIPVALVGTVLLNPRIKEYDVAALTVPLLLIVSRGLRILLNAPDTMKARSALDRVGESSMGAPEQAANSNLKINRPVFLAASGWFLAANFAASGEAWKPIELALLITLFGAGVWTTLQRTQLEDEQAPSRIKLHTELFEEAAKMTADLAYKG
jgi:hypothetical protein